MSYWARFAVLACFAGWVAWPSWGQSTGNGSSPWQAVVANDRGQFYIDLTSLRRSEGMARFKTLLDYRQAQMTHNGKAFRSAQSLMEIDCQSQMGRIIEMNYYTGAMMTGTLVEKQGMLQDWQNIDPESPVRRLSQKACR